MGKSARQSYRHTVFTADYRDADSMIPRHGEFLETDDYADVDFERPRGFRVG